MKLSATVTITSTTSAATSKLTADTAVALISGMNNAAWTKEKHCGNHLGGYARFVNVHTKESVEVTYSL